MLSPVREDTLGTHATQLKWMGYPFAILLVINLTCVLYAVSRTGPERELPAPSQAVADSEPTHLPEGTSLTSDGRPTDAVASPETKSRSTEPSRHAEEATPSKFEIEKIATFLSLPTPEDTVGLLSHWGERLEDWKATAVPLFESLEQTVRPETIAESGASGALISGTFAQSRSAPSSSAQNQQAEGHAAPGQPAPIRASGSPAREPREESRVAAVPHSNTPPVAHAPVSESASPGLTIHNPRSTGGAVLFLANQQQVALAPGETKSLEEGEHLIRFHRGGRFGNAEYRLDGGTYYFTVTKNGWTLLEDEVHDVR